MIKCIVSITLFLITFSSFLWCLSFTFLLKPDTSKIMQLTIFTRSLCILLIVGPFFLTANGFFFDKLERFKKFTLPGYASSLGFPFSGMSNVCIFKFLKFLVKFFVVFSRASECASTLIQTSTTLKDINRSVAVYFKT